MVKKKLWCELAISGQLPSATHSCCGDSHKHKEPNKQELHHWKPQTKEIISFVPTRYLSDQSHRNLVHAIQHPAWFTQLASVPDSLTFPVPSYYTAHKILCSHALVPSWTFLWLLYPHHMSYSMAPYSPKLSLTVCWPLALASSTFEVCHLVFTLCVCKFNAILT